MKRDQIKLKQVLKKVVNDRRLFTASAQEEIYKELEEYIEQERRNSIDHTIGYANYLATKGINIKHQDNEEISNKMLKDLDVVEKVEKVKIDFTIIEERWRLYERASNKWGRDPQLIAALEELAELSVEIAKHLNGKRGFDIMGLVDELADASIMMEQVVFIFKCENAVKGRLETKLNKLNDLINQDGDLHSLKQ